MRRDTFTFRFAAKSNQGWMCVYDRKWPEHILFSGNIIAKIVTMYVCAQHKYRLRCHSCAALIGNFVCRICHAPRLPYPSPLFVGIYSVLMRGTNKKKKKENQKMNEPNQKTMYSIHENWLICVDCVRKCVRLRRWSHIFHLIIASKSMPARYIFTVWFIDKRTKRSRSTHQMNVTNGASQITHANNQS